MPHYVQVLEYSSFSLSSKHKKKDKTKRKDSTKVVLLSFILQHIVAFNRLIFIGGCPIPIWRVVFMCSSQIFGSWINIILTERNTIISFQLEI
jgi:hypothetical protein